MYKKQKGGSGFSICIGKSVRMQIENKKNMNTNFELGYRPFEAPRNQPDAHQRQGSEIAHIPSNIADTIRDVRAKIQEAQKKWDQKAEINARYTEIQEKEMPKVEDQTWVQKIQATANVAVHLPQIIARQTERAYVHLQDADNRKELANKILEESAATVIGIATKAAVVATGSAVIVTVGGFGLSAVPIASVGIMAAGAMREAFKMRHAFTGKTKGREFYQEQLGLKSFRQTDTGIVTKAATLFSRGLKNNAIAETFNAAEHQVKRHAIQQSLKATPIETFAHLKSQTLDRPISEHIVEQMKHAKISLDTAQTKEERIAARDTIKHLYKTLMISAEKQGQIVERSIVKGTTVKDSNGNYIRAEKTLVGNVFNKDVKDGLKTSMTQINAELDSHVKIAATKSVVATFFQRGAQFLTGVGIYEVAEKAGLADAVRDAWAESFKTPSAIAQERYVYKTYLPQVINNPPESTLKIVPNEQLVQQVQQTANDTSVADKVASPTGKMVMTTMGPQWISESTVAPVIETQSAPQIELEITKDRFLFETLKDNKFSIDTKGSAQTFLDQVAPFFVKEGRMTQEQVDELQKVIASDPQNAHSAEWLRWKYGSQKFDKIFTVYAGEKISVGQSDILPDVQNLPDTTTPVTENIQPVNVSPIAPQVIEQEGISPAIPKPAPEIVPAPAQPVPIAAPTLVESPIPAPQIIPRVEAPAIPKVEAPIAIPAIIPENVKQEGALSFAILKPENASTSPITLSTDQEEIFKFNSTAPISEWVNIPMSQNQPVDAIGYMINQAKNVVEMGWHSRYSAKAQLGEFVRQWVEGAGTKTDPTRFTEIQIQQHIDSLTNDIKPRLTFAQDGNQVTYELYDAHHTTHAEVQTMGDKYSDYASQPDSLVIAYCSRAHADAFKMLALNYPMPQEIKENLEIIQGIRPGNIKQAVDATTEWYASLYSPQDTQTILQNLRETGPASLKPSIDVLLNPQASGEEVNAATLEVSNWLSQKDPDAYRMFRLMYDGMDHIKDTKWMNENFKEYYSWNRQVLVFKAVDQN
jgi:hypothetical protein